MLLVNIYSLGDFSIFPRMILGTTGQANCSKSWTTEDINIDRASMKTNWSRAVLLQTATLAPLLLLRIERTYMQIRRMKKVSAHRNRATDYKSVIRTCLALDHRQKFHLRQSLRQLPLLKIIHNTRKCGIGHNHCCRTIYGSRNVQTFRMRQRVPLCFHVWIPTCLNHLSFDHPLYLYFQQ